MGIKISYSFLYNYLKIKEYLSKKIDVSVKNPLFTNEEMSTQNHL